MLAVLLPVGPAGGLHLDHGQPALHQGRVGEVAQRHLAAAADAGVTQGCGSNLVVGASAGDFGLWFDEDLNKGRSQECATFGNPALTPSSDFAVNCMEVWAFQSST